MTTRLSLAVVAILSLVAGAAARAQKKEPARIPASILFHEKVYALEPWIDLALMITEDQHDTLFRDYEQTLGAPALAELRQKAAGFKLNPRDAEAAAAWERLKSETARAREEMKRRIDATLNEEQKATIRRVNQAVEEVVRNALTPEQRLALAAAPRKE